LYFGNRRGQRRFLGGLRSGSIFDGEDDLSHAQLVAFSYPNFSDGAAHRRRHLYHRLVGFEFHHGLALGNASAGLDHQADQVAALDVLAQFGQFKFRCHSLGVPLALVSCIDFYQWRAGRPARPPLCWTGETPVSPLAGGRIAFFRIDAKVADCFLQHFRTDGFGIFAAQRM